MSRKIKVWVGFSDGKPHEFKFTSASPANLAVYPTRKAARSDYEDVRSAMLVFAPVKRRK